MMNSEFRMMNKGNTIETLKDLFEQMVAFEQRSEEATFLSIGGRGYYENPTSDLLQFFLIAKNSHGLNTLFLEALWECLPEFTKPNNFSQSLEEFKVTREVTTDNRKRLDFILHAPGWIMAIENKIRHEQINPFSEYEEYVQQVKQANDKEYHVILSPSGESSQEGWVGLSYKNLNRAIKKRLDELPSKQQSTKWWHFAQDFILHLNQELYNHPMKPEEVTFAEENQQQLAEAADFQVRYREHLKQRLAKLVNDHDVVSGCYGHNQNTRCCIRNEGWEGSKISWWYNPQGDHKFELTVYLYTPSDSILEVAKNTFENERKMKYWPEDNNRWQCWGTECFFSNSAEAEKELQELSQIVFDLYLEK